MDEVSKVLDELILNVEKARERILELWDNSDTSFKCGDIDRAERAVKALKDISDTISNIPLS